MVINSFKEQLNKNTDSAYPLSAVSRQLGEGKEQTPAWSSLQELARRLNFGWTWQFLTFATDWIFPAYVKTELLTYGFDLQRRRTSFRPQSKELKKNDRI